MPRIGIGQLLEIFEKAVDRTLGYLPSPRAPDNLSVAEYEKSLHHLNGLANDTFYAAVRALNEASRVVLNPIEQRLFPTKRDLFLRRLMKAIEVASELNGLEWVLDWVTYCDLVVSDIESGLTPRVRLDHADARRSLLLELAVRRKFILTRNRVSGPPRYVREMLKASEASVLEAAVEHYAAMAGTDTTSVNPEVLQEQSAILLSAVGSEDDLLAIAGATARDARCATYYLLAMCLRWYGLGAAEVR